MYVSVCEKKARGKYRFLELFFSCSHQPSRISNLFRVNLLTSARYPLVCVTHLFIMVRACLKANPTGITLVSRYLDVISQDGSFRSPIKRKSATIISAWTTLNAIEWEFNSRRPLRGRLARYKRSRVYDHKMELGREVGGVFYFSFFGPTEAPAVFHG